MAAITRMQGADAGFLYMETPSMHMHTLKIALLEPSAHVTYDNLVAAMLERLRRMPALRRRVVPVPFALNHPVLVTQRRLDPARHFFRHDLGGDATMRDLEHRIGDICSTPLQRDVPLWEIHMCEGLADGRVAIVGKIHHAMADGVAANAMLANVMDVSSAELRARVHTETEPGVDVPSRSLLIRHALRDAVRQMWTFPGLVGSTARRLVALVRYRRQMDADVPLPVRDTPPCSINGPLTPRRSFATVTLPLAEMKRVRDVHGDIGRLTLNDVVLGVTSGALRRWLADHDEHPRSSLTAGVPIGMDPADSEPRLIGNNVSNLFTTLATDVDDPGERLATIALTTRHAKAISQTLGNALMEWTQFAPPAPFAAAVRAYSRLRGARFHPAAFTAIVSNVPGPRERVKVAGAHLSDVFSVGPLTDGIGLNVTVWSYVDKMNFSLLACPDLLPDVERLASHFPAALAELLGEQPATAQVRSDGPDDEQATA